jgi:hypothetical protein
VPAASAQAVRSLACATNEPERKMSVGSRFHSRRSLGERRVRALRVLEWSRECPAVEVDDALPGEAGRPNAGAAVRHPHNVASHSVIQGCSAAE